jgi:hypothetical protein
MIGFRSQLFAAGTPSKWMSQIFLSKAADNGFLQFKRQQPFKFSKNYPAAKHYTDIYRLVLLLTHLSFRWTIPLTLGHTI